MLKKIFTWWNGATLGTLFDIGRRASAVGEDQYGNKYYEEKKISLEGRPRRYVIYNGYAEPSRVPADWHGWLHHTFALPPTEDPMILHAWEKPHRPNMTGTRFAWHRKSSLAADHGGDGPSLGYVPWSPEKKSPDAAATAEDPSA